MSDAEITTPSERIVNWTDTEWPTELYSEQSHVGMRIAFVTLNIISTILILTLNPLCLVVIQRAANLQPTSKIFMASVIVSDLCSSVFVIPQLIILEAAEDGTHVSLISVVCATIANVLNYQCLLSLIALTTDRYLAIAWCLRYPTLMTVHKAKCIVLCNWIFGMIYSVSYSVIASSVQQAQQALVFTNWGILLVGLAVIVAMYVHILVIASRQARRIAQDNQPAQGNNPPQRASTKSFTTVLIIIAVVVMGWVPGVVVLPLHASVDIIYMGNILLNVTHWMNVLIFCLRNKDTRETLHGMISACCGAILQKCSFQKS